jgi:hypothetical protein
MKSTGWGSFQVEWNLTKADGIITDLSTVKSSTISVNVIQEDSAKAEPSSSSASMALQHGVGQSLLLLGFHPEGFLVSECAFCSE